MAKANSTARNNTHDQQADRNREEFRRLVAELTEDQRQQLIAQFRPFVTAVEVQHG